jgi:hypothetical protein
MPHRKGSSTVVFNRNAQFRPHTDSGAGAGQSCSLIVALGRFAGGELVVESTPHDIAYRPLEFDGWCVRALTPAHARHPGIDYQGPGICGR